MRECDNDKDDICKDANRNDKDDICKDDNGKGGLSG